MPSFPEGSYHPTPARLARIRTDRRFFTTAFSVLVVEDARLGTFEYRLHEVAEEGPLRVLADGRILYAGADQLWLITPGSPSAIADLGPRASHLQGFALSERDGRVDLWTGSPDRWRLELPRP